MSLQSGFTNRYVFAGIEQLIFDILFDPNAFQHITWFKSDTYLNFKNSTNQSSSTWNVTKQNLFVKMNEFVFDKSNNIQHAEINKFFANIKNDIFTSIKNTISSVRELNERRLIHDIYIEKYHSAIKNLLQLKQYQSYYGINNDKLISSQSADNSDNLSFNIDFFLKRTKSLILYDKLVQNHVFEQNNGPLFPGISNGQSIIASPGCAVGAHWEDFLSYSMNFLSHGLLYIYIIV